MTTPNDGGPVYPVDFGWSQPPGTTKVVREKHYGLTLRDWFAGQALAGEVARWGNDNCPHDHASAVAHNCYAMADAMLAARVATKQPST